MKALFAGLLSLGAIAVGVLFMVARDRAPEAPPPPEAWVDSMREPNAPGGEADETVVLEKKVAPGGRGPRGDDGRFDLNQLVAGEGLNAPDMVAAPASQALAGDGLDAFAEGGGRGGGGRALVGRIGAGAAAPAPVVQGTEADRLIDDGEELEKEAKEAPKREAASGFARLSERSLEVDKAGYFAARGRRVITLESLNIEGHLDRPEEPAAADLALLKPSGTTALSPSEGERPDQFLPRMCYFENTYLGGNAAYQERLRRMAAELGQGPHLLAALEPQAFDAPEDAGLRLTATLDRAALDRPGRVMLQVGLQGSRRYGWRRPPLDVALVVDASADPWLEAAADALLKRLGPQDRLAIVRTGEADPVVALGDRRAVRTALARHPEIRAPGAADDRQLEQALVQAGEVLRGADDQARVPGTRTILLLTSHGQPARVERARRQVQALAEQGVVTSVVALATAHDAAWWQVAAAGNGNLHRAGDAASLGTVVEAELASLARVIARLLRVNVRLAPGVEAIRVVGARVLDQAEVRAVKAREVATDRNLSRALGLKADRGQDDDGIQTVIPYFYGGDSHVILIELWVDRPGAVAEISLKFKDMVNLENATARAAVALSARPRTERVGEAVQRNLRGFTFADALRQGADRVERGDFDGARWAIEAAAQVPADQRVAAAFAPLLASRTRPAILSEALRLAADRRIGGAAEEEDVR